MQETASPSIRRTGSLHAKVVFWLTLPLAAVMTSFPLVGFLELRRVLTPASDLNTFVACTQCRVSNIGKTAFRLPGQQTLAEAVTGCCVALVCILRIYLAILRYFALTQK